MITIGGSLKPHFTAQDSLFSKAVHAVELALFSFAVTAVHGVRQDKTRGTRRG